MTDGISIVLDYAERSVTPRALWAAVLVTQSALARRETGLRTPMTCSMLPCTRIA